MGRRRANPSNPKTRERFIKEGRGQGEGPAYRPWLTVFDLPSDGFRHRVRSEKLDRVQHWFSEGEWGTGVLANMSPYVVDIREQFPLLPLEKTLRIAEELGVDHPAFGGNPVVVTVDLLLTLRIDGVKRYLAVDVKTHSGLRTEKAVANLAIARQFLADQGIPWRLVFRESIPLAIEQNLRAVRRFTGEGEEPPGVDDVMEDRALDFFLTSEGPVPHVAQNFEAEVGREPGFGLALFHRLVANWRLPVNLSKRLDPDLPLSGFLREEVADVVGD